VGAEDLAEVGGAERDAVGRVGDAPLAALPHEAEGQARLLVAADLAVVALAVDRGDRRHGVAVGAVDLLGRRGLPLPHDDAGERVPPRREVGGEELAGRAVLVGGAGGRVDEAGDDVVRAVA